MTFEAPPLRDWRAITARVTTFGPVTDVRLVETLSPCVAGIIEEESETASPTKNADASGWRDVRGRIFDHLKLCDACRHPAPTVGTYHTSQ